jgi:uncharacterized membrane protein
MNTFSIRESFSKGWDIFLSNKKVLIASTFVIMVASAISNRDEGAYRNVGISGLLIMAAIFVANLIIQIGWIKLLLKLIDGEVATVKELINHSRLFWRFALTYILLSLLMVLGLLLLVIPMFYVVLTYSFAPIIVIDEHVPVKEAFRRSKEIARGHRWKLLGLMLCLVLANLAGALVFFVGLFISIPVSMLAYLLVYRKLLNHKTVTV